MKLILTAVAALVVLAMPVHAAEKPAANAAANLATDKMSQADCDKAMTDCKGDSKCLSDLEAKGCTKAQ